MRWLLLAFALSACTPMFVHTVNDAIEIASQAEETLAQKYERALAAAAPAQRDVVRDRFRHAWDAYDAFMHATHEFAWAIATHADEEEIRSKGRWVIAAEQAFLREVEAL